MHGIGPTPTLVGRSAGFEIQSFHWLIANKWTPLRSFLPFGMGSVRPTSPPGRCRYVVLSFLVSFYCDPPRVTSPSRYVREVYVWP